MTSQSAHSRIFTWLSVAVAVLALAGANAAQAGSSNSLMDVSADGALLACSNRDSGTVTFVDLATNKVLREVSVGHHPEGVSFIGKSHELAVAPRSLAPVPISRVQAL